MLVLLLACAEVPPPPPPTSTTMPPPPERFVLVGRHSPGLLLEPPLPEGPARLGPDCATVNEALRGDGPPCLAERWASAGRTALLLVAGRQARFKWGDEPPVRTPTRWETLGNILETCLGDPFTIPPAGDPGALRDFTGTAWRLSLTGRNRCGLEGTLELPIRGGRADWKGLAVDGVGWTEGGRERAMPAYRGIVREAVARHAEALDAAGRVQALQALEGDETAEAAALRERLRR